MSKLFIENWILVSKHYRQTRLLKISSYNIQDMLRTSKICHVEFYQNFDFYKLFYIDSQILGENNFYENYLKLFFLNNTFKSYCGECHIYLNKWTQILNGIWFPQHYKKIPVKQIPILWHFWHLNSIRVVSAVGIFTTESGYTYHRDFGCAK